MQTSSFVKFDLGTIELRILAFIRVLSSSAVFCLNDARRMADPVAEIIFVTGTYFEDTAKLRPY